MCTLELFDRLWYNHGNNHLLCETRIKRRYIYEKIYSNSIRIRNHIHISYFYTAGISETAVATSEQIEDVFYDDFSSGTLDPDKWLVAYKNWGGKVTENGEKVDYNGGVIPQNVSVQNENQS